VQNEKVADGDGLSKQMEWISTEGNDWRESQSPITEGITYNI